MAGLVPAIHAFAEEKPPKTWMPGTSQVKPGHDDELDVMSKIPSKGLNCVDLSGYCGFATLA